MASLFVNSIAREIAAVLMVVLVGATSNALANDGYPVSGERMGLNTIVVAQNDSLAVKLVSSGKTSDALLKDDDDDDDLLEDNDFLKDKENTEAPSKVQASAEVGKDAKAEHESLFAESRFPAAATCGTCHPKEYREWSVSQHAYSQLSPVYLSLNNKINQLSNGSNGDFCIRCHNQVGANLGENSFDSNLTRHPTSREGITCVVCHRLNKEYGKVSGRLALVEGGLTEPVFGPIGNKEMARVLENTHEYRVETNPKKSGRKIHKEAKQFASISSPAFCGTCHDVTLFNGFRLEEAFSEYRTSPAAARGVTCQDCHMGKVQGVVSGYDFGPAAVVGGVPTKPRKLANHFFAGPDYSVLPPGIFPHNSDAQQMATIEEWLKFDIKAGWGTDAFEDKVADNHKFPERWESIDDRYDAREIIGEQLELLEWARQKRLEVLRAGYILGDIVTERADADGIGSGEKWHGRSQRAYRL
jgi:nitrate/TMAO reductase-like tetraheme cytochrome c subunit